LKHFTIFATSLKNLRAESGYTRKYTYEVI
jgi:hypothetical protein